MIWGGALQWGKVCNGFSSPLQIVRGEVLQWGKVCNITPDRHKDGQTDTGQNDPYVPLCYAGDTETDFLFFLNAEHVSVLSLLFSKVMARAIFFKSRSKSRAQNQQRSSSGQGQHIWCIIIVLQMEAELLYRNNFFTYEQTDRQPWWN